MAPDHKRTIRGIQTIGEHVRYFKVVQVLLGGIEEGYYWSYTRAESHRLNSSLQGGLRIGESITFGNTTWTRINKLQFALAQL